MASTRELTARWLAQVAGRYRSPDRVVADVLSALDQYTSLRPKTDVYTYDDGRTQLLLVLHGLLPISFRSASYNIPVALWLTLSYPAEPPLVYVVPTSDMLVRPSHAVELSGKCNLEYTTGWSRKPDTCSLSSLLEAMQVHFSREPPLYSKPHQKPSVASSSAPTTSSEVAPSAVPRDRGHVQQVQAHTSHPPRLPPKPYAPAGIIPPPTGAVVSSPASILSSVPPASQAHFELQQSAPGSPPSLPQTHSSYAPAYSSFPAYASVSDAHANLQQPLFPGQSHPGGSGPMSMTHIHSEPAQPDSVVPTAHSEQGPPPYVTAHPPVPPRPPVPPSPFAHTGHQRSVSNPQVSRVQSPPSAVSPSPPLPPSHTYTQPQAPPRPFPPQSYGPTPTLAPPAPVASVYRQPSAYQQSPDSVTASSVYSPSMGAPTRPAPSLPPPDLLDQDDETSSHSLPTASSSSLAPPPPRPPNPQTLALHNAVLALLHDSLTRLSASHADAVARQRAQQAELLAGPAAIRDESARLTAVRDVCQAVGARWAAVVREGESVLGEVRRRGEVEIDEMVCASSIVGNQLINLVAEDNAIEDTMYHLHRALNSGRIDLERFLRTTRVLAEEQFMKRALVEKIVRGLPIGSLG